MDLNDRYSELLGVETELRAQLKAAKGKEAARLKARLDMVRREEAGIVEELRQTAETAEGF